MDRRKFVTLSALGTAAFWAERWAGTDSPRPPNVLLITADDLNWDSVGAYGCPIPGITPNLDRLASEGVRFAQAYVNVAACQPCRASIFTGRYPHRHGAVGFEPIREDIPTLTEQLHAAGYINGILGKVSHYEPAHRFFWDWIVDNSDLGNGRDPNLFYMHTKLFLAQAVSLDASFFLHVNSRDPHRPFLERINSVDWLSQNSGRDHTDGIVSPDEVPVPGFLPDLPEVRIDLARYFRAVGRLDETVGRILQALDESGTAENTIVLFLSDNGMPFPFAKGNCYLASTRTPLIIRWPSRIRAGAMDRRHFVSCIDLAPTILDALGLPPMPDTDGRSLLPLLQSGGQSGRDRVFTMANETRSGREYPMRCLRTERFAYIFNAWADGLTYYRDGPSASRTMKAMEEAAQTDPVIAARVKFFRYRAREELYDLARDPNELHNLIGEARYERQIQRLRMALAGVMASTGDPLLPEFRKALGFPKLVWCGDPGFEQGGVSPAGGEPRATEFTFKVKLQDLDGYEPDRVLLILHRDAEARRAFRMRPGPEALAEGRSYSIKLRLPAGNYAYRFIARYRDRTQAQGPPTQLHQGPFLPSWPFLVWEGSPGYETDGVEPHSGNADDIDFTFRVRYRANDGDLPKYVEVMLWREGAHYRKLTMATSDQDPDPLAGITYEVATKLPVGSYEYQFVAADQHGAARGPASDRRPGPVAMGDKAMGVGHVTAVPTKGRGAEIIFSFSEPTTADVCVRNVAGRLIRVVSRKRQCPAGTSVLLWNGKDSYGRPVPGGTYLIEIVGRRPTGSEVRALTYVTIGR